jgi:hypothetical protein
MGARHEGAISTAVRWLGAPPTVVAVVLLLLNDRVWKQQWPGPVTGKLSDVAGLVLAPPLLALALAACRLRHPATWALAATGIGFVAAKATESGAQLASAAWSVVTPSVVLRDPTDLIALPALAVAWGSYRWARRNHLPHRRRAIVAAGAVVLPFAVVATAATSCEQPDGVRTVDVYEGRFVGSTTTERHLVAHYNGYRHVLVERDGSVADLRPDDSTRLGGRGTWTFARSACSPTVPSRCWRGGTGDAVVEASTDAGLTWQREYALGEDQVTKVLEEEGDEHCGERTGLRADAVAVLDTTGGPLVAVAASNAGLLVRTPDSRWTRWSLRTLNALPDLPWLVTPRATGTTDPTGTAGTATPTLPGQSPPAAPSPTPTKPSTPTPTLTPLDPVTPAYPKPRERPTARTPTARPCATPTTRVVTPDPRNGPPVTSTYCPVA